jgi:ribose transport system ATP-binding protein
VSLTVRGGEIVSLGGVVGSGRTELARAIFGAEPITSGTMILAGQRYAPRSPRDAIAAGVALLPEDRKGQGLILSAAIRENASYPCLARFARAGVIDRSAERSSVAEWTESLAIKAPSLERPVSQLSGGNQQKVVVARWMLAHARVLLFDEPTRGIDVGAKAEIYALMRQVAAKGAAILMISSDLPEAIGMADRLIVMRGGRVAGVLTGGAITTHAVGRLMFESNAAA